MSKVGNYFILDDKPIGRGTFGVVYRAYRDREPQTIYALKRIDLMSLKDIDKRHCFDEVKAMKELQHQHIVKFHDSFTYETRFLIIVMEYCKGGSVKNYIQQSPPISQEECLQIMKQICLPLKFLHDRKMIHRDVKTDNIFLTADKIVKLGDLGLTRLLDNPSSLTQQCGSPLYRSPEIFNDKAYSEKTDIWSLGCCMYEIATKMSPFSGRTEEELRLNISEKTLEERAVPYSEDVKSLIQYMLEKEPQRRPNITEVLDTVNSLLQPPPQTTDDSEGEILQAPVLSAGMRNLTMARASLTYPGPCISEKGQIQRPKRERRHPSVTSSSSEDHGYVSSEAKDANVKPSGADSHIVHIPVLMTKKEADMMAHAQQFEKTLQGYMTEQKWQKMLELLNEHRKDKNLDERRFLERMKQILGSETYEKCEIFLITYWKLKAPLLTKSFKIAHMER